MDKATNRRGALMSLVKATAGVSALGIACSVSQCTAPAHGAPPTAATAIGRAEWDRAYFGLEQARQANVSHVARWDRIADAYRRICERAAKRIDWKKLHVGLTIFSRAERERFMERGDLVEAERRYLEGERKWWWSQDPAARKAEFREGLGQISEYRRVRDHANNRLGYDRATERCDELADAVSEAEGALMAMPAPHGRALLWKLEHLNEVSDGSTSGWSAEYVAQTMADARRLLSREA